MHQDLLDAHTASLEEVHHELLDAHSELFRMCSRSFYMRIFEAISPYHRSFGLGSMDKHCECIGQPVVSTGCLYF